MSRYYVYKYYKGEELLYVGKTTNIHGRYSSHKRSSDWFAEHTRHVLAELPNKTTMDMYEVYFINKFLPTRNIKDARQDRLPYELPDLDFKDYKNYIEEITLRTITTTREQRQSQAKYSKENNAKKVDSMVEFLNGMKYKDVVDLGISKDDSYYHYYKVSNCPVKYDFYADLDAVFTLEFNGDSPLWAIFWAWDKSLHFDSIGKGSDYYFKVPTKDWDGEDLFQTTHLADWFDSKSKGLGLECSINYK